MLDKELTARGTERPVVVLSDSHTSRKATVVLEFAKGIGSRFHFEPPHSSGFLQALDQYNKMFHEAYTKEKNKYRPSSPVLAPATRRTSFASSRTSGRTGRPPRTGSPRSRGWASCRLASPRRTSIDRSSRWWRRRPRQEAAHEHGDRVAGKRREGTRPSTSA
mmetsp:Transcript_22501/g.89346  ORF Transcript_22501/g.89346 Transcript_22501/m.89346 type:complete len:163 (+) Transcript_22501:5421-5909(+)